jgi:hypothetical protein
MSIRAVKRMVELRLAFEEFRNGTFIKHAR